MQTQISLGKIKMTGELIGNGNAKYTGCAGSLDTVGRVFQGDGFFRKDGKIVQDG